MGLGSADRRVVVVRTAAMAMVDGWVLKDDTLEIARMTVRSSIVNVKEPRLLLLAFMAAMVRFFGSESAREMNCGDKGKRQ